VLDIFEVGSKLFKRRKKWNSRRKH